ncbi:hypothetical protein PAMP_014590 [Pampus punctatissimus]
MVELRWIKMSLFLILGLQFTAVTGLNHLYITVRDGDEATLSCENVTTDQNKCDGTTWIFGSSRYTTVELIRLGQIGRDAGSKSDRLSVTVNCSLVIKNVTVKDVGSYSCRQFKSGEQQGSDSVFFLSVVTMTEHKNTDTVTLNCSVSTFEQCRHTVKWLYNNNYIDKNNKDLIISESTCSVTVFFLTSHFIYTSKYKFLKCKVTDLNSGKVQLFNFSSQVKPGENMMICLKSLYSDVKNNKVWWWYILVAVALVAVLIIVVVLIRRRRAKVNKRQLDGSIGLELNPAVTQAAPQTSEDTADPEDGVSYASISYTSSRARVHGKNEGDAVTYSTVKASSSSAAASTDPSSLYATIG